MKQAVPQFYRAVGSGDGGDARLVPQATARRWAIPRSHHCPLLRGNEVPGCLME
jgi:hypothetical protein